MDGCGRRSGSARAAHFPDVAIWVRVGFVIAMFAQRELGRVSQVDVLFGIMVLDPCRRVGR